jgi:predicted transposase/invertase (TIGR01784 family)
MKLKKVGGTVDEINSLQQKMQNKRINELIDNMTLFDDDLMSKVFAENIEATQLLLRIILDKDDIQVLTVIGQKELENPIVGGRNIRLDVFATDSTGRYFDIEVQRSNEGASFRRARFHSSMLDVRMLKSGQKFKELLDSYVIFITENDVVGYGLPLYHIRQVIEETKETFTDGSHVIYVNGSYKGNDAIGKLIHDFRCKKSEEMYYGELSEGIKHFKETEEGREIMCDAVKEYAEEYAKEYAEEYAKEYAEEYAKEYAEEYAKERYNQGVQQGVQQGMQQGALETAIKYHLNYNIPLEKLCSDFGFSKSEALDAINQYKLRHSMD